MKRIILFFVIFAAACSICWLVAYRAGFACAKQLQEGTFVLSLGALEKIRAGDVGEATQNMETLCFYSADLLYRDSSYRDQTLKKIFLQNLIQYRATYRTNSAEWTPSEQKLERDLASWK